MGPTNIVSSPLPTMAAIACAAVAPKTLGTETVMGGGGGGGGGGGPFCPEVSSNKSLLTCQELGQLRIFV